MANTLVTLKHSTINSGNPIQIACTSVKVGFNKKNVKKPNANYDQYPAEVITSGRENPKYFLENAKIDVKDLSYDNFLKLINLENDESDPLVLNVMYNGKYLVDSLSSTKDIPVIVDGSINAVFSTMTSKDAYMPSVTIPLVEVGL